MRDHPAMFQAKQERCKQVAEQRGFGYKTTGRKRRIMRLPGRQYLGNLLPSGPKFLGVRFLPALRAGGLSGNHLL